MTLHDGTLVMSDSEEWRAECEARHVLSLPSLAARRRYLRGERDDHGKLRGGVLEKRGEEATQRLEALIKAIFYANK